MREPHYRTRTVRTTRDGFAIVRRTLRRHGQEVHRDYVVVTPAGEDAVMVPRTLARAVRYVAELRAEAVRA